MAGNAGVHQVQSDGWDGFGRVLSPGFCVYRLEAGRAAFVGEDPFDDGTTSPYSQKEVREFGEILHDQVGLIRRILIGKPIAIHESPSVPTGSRPHHIERVG